MQPRLEPEYFSNVRNAYHVEKAHLILRFSTPGDPQLYFLRAVFFTLNPAMICIRGQEVRDSATESGIWILCSQSQRVCTFPPNFSAAQRLRGEIWTNSVSISTDSSCKGGTKVHFCDVLQTHLSRSLERLQDFGLRHPWWKKKRTLLYFWYIHFSNIMLKRYLHELYFLEI